MFADRYHARFLLKQSPPRLTLPRRFGPRNDSAPPGCYRSTLDGASRMTTLTNSADTTLRQRAMRVIPGGLWGHMNAANLPDGYPQYFASAEGCRLTDVDGRSFVDLMCAWGPIVLGHRHKAVEAAVRQQAMQGDCMNGPGPILVELAELLVDTVPHADWCLFGKNGTDATTSCVTIARAGTGRRKVLTARGAYHGAVPWCSPSVAGVTAEDRAHLLHYTYNDIDSVDSAVEQAGGDLAAIVVSAFRHDFGHKQELPTPAFASTSAVPGNRSASARISRPGAKPSPTAMRCRR
jgi:glutamate-1-semialdehyde 2,1-aminomutase